MTVITVLSCAALFYCAAYFAYCLGRGEVRDALGAAVLCLLGVAAVIFLAAC